MDLILILQVLSGKDVAINMIGDCHSDEKIDMSDGLRLLRTIAQ